MTRAKGIDLSYWNVNKSSPGLDLSKAVGSGAVFVFARVADGIFKTEPDWAFDFIWRQAKDVGLKRGPYWLLRGDVPIEDQANRFRDWTGLDIGELPPVIDVEKHPLSSAQVINFANLVEEKFARQPLIYTSPGFFGSLDPIPSEYAWTDYKLWNAQYPYFGYAPWHDAVVQTYDPWLPKPWKPDNWLFWQWTDKAYGSQYGVDSASIDLNWFNGDKSEFDLYVESIVDVPAPPDPPATDVEAVLEDLEYRLSILEDCHENKC